jgi:hypothetical protein
VQPESLRRCPLYLSVIATMSPEKLNTLLAHVTIQHRSTAFNNVHYLSCVSEHQSTCCESTTPLQQSPPFAGFNSPSVPKTTFAPATLAFSPSNRIAISSKVWFKVSTYSTLRLKMITYWTPGLHIEEVDRQTLEHKNHNVYDVELPTQCFDANGVHILVEDTRQRREHKAKCKTLCANVEGQDLNGIRDRQTRPGNTSSTVEEEDHSQDSRTGTRVASLCIYGAAGGPDAECDEHAYACAEEECATADSIDEEGAAKRDEETPDCQPAVDQCLVRAAVNLSAYWRPPQCCSYLLGDADGLQHSGQIVRDKPIELIRRFLN